MDAIDCKIISPAVRRMQTRGIVYAMAVLHFKLAWVGNF